MRRKRYRSWREAERIRTEACRCAALIMANRPNDTPAPLVWSLAVFFETYISDGSKRTLKEFGPKPPTKLTSVK